MVLETLGAGDGAIGAQAVFPAWDWRLALDVVVALGGGGTGATLFVREGSSMELRALASTLPDERRRPAARAVERAETDSPRGRGAPFFVVEGLKTTVQGAWWRVPIRDGAELLGALYLEYADRCEPCGRAQDCLVEWARIAARALTNHAAFRAADGRLTAPKSP